MEAPACAGPVAMAEELARSTVQRPPSAWLPAAAESEVYEGIRRGEETAFRAVAQPLQPVLRRLSRLAVHPSADADAIVVHTWEVALRGLGMFRWHTPFATWVAGITVAHSRAHAAHDSAPRPPVPSTPARPARGPADWSDLPWSARWEGALPTLAAAQGALPLAQREVLHTRHVEQWPSRRICDVLALTGIAYQRLLAEGEAQLRDALAPLVGESGEGPHRAAQTAAVVRLLSRPVDVVEEPIDPRAVAAFRRWRTSRRTGWRARGERLLHPRAWPGLVLERCA